MKQQLSLERMKPHRNKPNRSQPLEAIGTARGAAWLRPVAAGLLALGLLAWGLAERHGSLSFMGAASLGYWLFAAGSSMAAPLRHIRADLKRCGRRIGPVETELAWTTTITSRSRLPRMWLQVTDIWLRVDEQDEVLEQLSCTRMLYPGTQRRLACEMRLSAVTLGVYRHGGTHIVTGDLLGWWRRERMIFPMEQCIAVQQSALDALDQNADAVGLGRAMSNKAIVIPSAAHWGSNIDMQQLVTQMVQTEPDPASNRAAGTEAWRESDGKQRQRLASQGMVTTSELRPYQKGDAWRSIQWRTYAKNRQLVVRPYQVMEQTDMIVWLDDSDEQGKQLSNDVFEALVDTTLEWVWMSQVNGYQGQIQLLQISTRTWVCGYESIMAHLAADRRLAGPDRQTAVHLQTAPQRYYSSQSAVIVISPYESTSRLFSLQFHYPTDRIQCWIQASLTSS